MGRNDVCDRWWFKAFAALMCLFLIQVFITFSNVQTFEEDKMSLKAEVESLERKRDQLRMTIIDRERDLSRLERKGGQLEVMIKDQVKLLPSGRKSDPMIYFITPTHFRPAQKADMTRLSYTLSHVPNLFWIVVEDASELSESIADIIKRSRLPYAHIHAATRSDMKMKYSDPNWYLPRGVEQRNAALGWIRTNLKGDKKGIVYFGDDDNAYDLRLFDEIRSVKSAGIWPVGIVGGLIVETPSVASNGTVVGFNAIWKPERPFPVDMAAFAVSVGLINGNPESGFKYDVPRGYQESQFLTSLGLSRQSLEPKANLCSKVFVWHTRTEKSKFESTDLIRIKNYKTSQFSSVEKESLGLNSAERENEF